MELPRVGLDLTEKGSAAGAVEAIARAEARGVPMIWSTVVRSAPDPLTFYAAAAVRTERIGLGTAVVPTYPRHPIVLATQVRALEQLAPGRLRVGIGPSHRPTIEGIFGIPMGTPLDHLREYLTVLRGLLWEGGTDFTGEYYSVRLDMDERVPVPIYVSALRERAFALAGELADGAISWLCPPDYLRKQAIPAMRRAAEAAGRDVPRMVAHVPVVMTEDSDMMLRAARARISGYGRLPFYARMFAAAGYPVTAGGQPTDALLDHLVVWGSPERVQERLEGLLDSGIDELLVMLIPLDDPAEEEARLSGILAAIQG